MPTSPFTSLSRFMRPLTVAAALGAAALGFGSAASAAGPEALASYQDWSAFVQQQDGGKVCFVVSEPKESRLSRRGAQRGDVFFLVTHWTGSGKFGQPSIIIGYPFKEGSQPTVRVGSDKFNFTAQGDGAWLADEEEEKRLLRAMRAGIEMEVVGLSSRGTQSTDVFSLRGVSAALDRIDKECK